MIMLFDDIQFEIEEAKTLIPPEVDPEEIIDELEFELMVLFVE